MKQAKKRELRLYVFWLIWVNTRTFALAIILSLFSTLFIYLSKGMIALNTETFLALKEIFYFTFPITFSISFILMLLLVFRALFSYDFSSFKVYLYDCKDELISKPLLSDITMIWRKWLFLTIWAIIVFSVLFIGLWKLVMSSFPSAHFFNGVTLYILITVFGGLVFTLALSKCKKVRIKDV